jgi:hypothetical protein
MPNGELTGMASKKKVKKQKLESKAKIRRRLFKLWSQKSLLIHNETCAITGMKRGEIINGKPAILDCHHIENRTNASLRFAIENSIILSKTAHKFGRNSAHRGMIWFSEWLRINRPKQHAYVLAHRDDPIDLEDRDVLYAIEAKLKAPPTEEELSILNVAIPTIVEPTGTLGGPDGMEKSDTPPMPNKP